MEHVLQRDHREASKVRPSVVVLSIRLLQFLPYIQRGSRSRLALVIPGVLQCGSSRMLHRQRHTLLLSKRLREVPESH